MPTNIKTFQNLSDRSMIAYNSENVGNSFLVPPTTTQATNPGLWISCHEDKPLVLSTSNGFCHIWDGDWKIHGKWEGSSNEIIFLDGSDQGVGGTIQVNIASDGGITMNKSE